jgi:hypothetical protein
MVESLVLRPIGETIGNEPSERADLTSDRRQCVCRVPSTYRVWLESR